MLASWLTSLAVLDPNWFFQARGDYWTKSFVGRSIIQKRTSRSHLPSIILKQTNRILVQYLVCQFDFPVLFFSIISSLPQPQLSHEVSNIKNYIYNCQTHFDMVRMLVTIYPSPDRVGRNSDCPVESASQLLRATVNPGKSFLCSASRNKSYKLPSPNNEL
jgi:hypothetical protein